MSAATDAVAPSAARQSLQTLLIGAVLFAIAVAAFLVIRQYGDTLPGLPGLQAKLAAPAVGAPSNALLRVLGALAAVLLVGAVLARLCGYIGQPPVIGEVLAGLLLGPSLLGPELSAVIMPPAIAPQLGIVAQLGIILYMFIIGLELNGGLLRERFHTAVTVSQASIALPFVMGGLLALYLYPRYQSADVPFTSFALFMGVAISITAFPVLARILTDRGLQRTELGILALGCAAADDVSAWCLLALVVGLVQAEMGSGLWVILWTLIYGTAMLVVVRPLLARLLARWNTDPLPRTASAVVFFALALSALMAEAIGIHALFGAFLLGAILPHDSMVARNFTRQLEPVVTLFLLPAFFAFTGMRTRLDLLTDVAAWASIALIILVASLAKFGGTYVAARYRGLNARDASALGVLMNTRGLVELIVLNVGLSLGVISSQVFAMMVVMALVTTVATAPLIKWIGAPQKPA